LKAESTGHSLVETVDSNPVEFTEVCLLWMLHVAGYSSLWWTDYSSRGVLLLVVFMIVIEAPHRGSQGPLDLLSHETKILISINHIWFLNFSENLLQW